MKEDKFYLQRALELAQTGANKGEVPVGAVLVNVETGEIVAEAHNAPILLHDPTAHAEILALRSAGQALQNYRMFNHDLFVTLEPCSMCAGAIANARIRRLVFAASDEKGGAIVNGTRFFEQPTCHWHPEVEQGELAEESSDMLRAFFRARRKKPTPDQMEGSDSQPE